MWRRPPLYEAGRGKVPPPSGNPNTPNVPLDLPPPEVHPSGVLRRPSYSEGGHMRPGLATLNSRALTSILVVALPVLVIAAAVVIGIGQRRQYEAQTTQLTHMAEFTASAIDAYVFRRILD